MALTRDNAYIIDGGHSAQGYSWSCKRRGGWAGEFNKVLPK